MLTTRKIQSLAPKAKRYVVTDGAGLNLRIHPSGQKSWVLRLSELGRVSDITLGRWPEMSLKAARQEARRRRKAAGLTPQRGYVLADAFTLWKNLKRGRIASYKDEKRRIERYIIKPLGSRQLDEITAPVVIHTVKALDKAGKRATLKRVLMRTREILDLAVCAGYIQHNPIERVSRVFAPPVVKPMPAVTWHELDDVMTIVAMAPLRIRQLFLWSVLSMLRPGENAKIKWSWIDGDLLTIPAAEMKKGREHRVPLTAEMANLLEVIKRTSPHPRSGYVFPAVRDGSNHISAQALAKWLRASELSGRLVAHGIRSIARSWMADNGIQYEVAEACLAHVVGSKVSRSYQRSDFLDARRLVMAAWSNHVSLCAERARLCTKNAESAP